jgi:hypothetical protein
MRFIILFLLATLSGCGMANQVSRDICSREVPNFLVCPSVDEEVEKSTCVVKGVRTLSDNGAVLFKGVARGCSLEEAQQAIEKLPITK